MTPIKEYESHEFTDYEFESEFENACEICGKPAESNDTLCYSCRKEFDELALLWRQTSEGVRERFKEEIV